jgi:hypothetical protein
MFTTSSTVRSAQSEEGRILLDLLDGRIFSVNAVGAKILDLVERGLDEPQIVDEIIRFYAVDLEAARPHVHDFLHTLCQYGVVRGEVSHDSGHRK